MNNDLDITFNRGGYTHSFSIPAHIASDKELLTLTLTSMIEGYLEYADAVSEGTRD